MPSLRPSADSHTGPLLGQSAASCRPRPRGDRYGPYGKGGSSLVPVESLSAPSPSTAMQPRFDLAVLMRISAM